ncbi:hypothetical protein M422DRAFT_59564 [Sphaerobolus stellatus SS14]|uniref:AB hydrolase-1 domain-containing protein n=1 Tax=Sphaerobolus stellatus (strain SS14) TaxID=990650 RepID=A0A0C9VI85_SPHS4|nr:hypothetical protein M422DRAFT_59564 [Sphaerobolus stellatus SS14]
MTQKLQVVEGEASFYVPSTGQLCKTWYKVFGDLSTSKQTPLVTLHGGPGVSHHYQLSLVDLAVNYGIPVIFYDQIGCGKSTHFPEKKGDGAFWNDDLFCDELDNLLEHLGVRDKYDLLGQSRGGMLAASFASRRPRGLNKLIIANSPASIELWVEGAMKLLSQLPPETQEIIKKHERDGTTDNNEYKEALKYFYNTHICQLNPWPKELEDSYGPNEFNVIGSLRNWSIITQLPNITTSTLVINGRYDEAQDVAVEPFFHHIPVVNWVQFHKSSHLPQWEQREEFMEIVGDFLMRY